MRDFLQALFRLFQLGTLYAIAVFICFTMSLLVDKHAADPNSFIALLGLAGALIAFAATYREKR